MDRRPSARAVFGVTPEGETVERIELSNDRGMSVGLLGLGASLHGLTAPDREGRFADVVLGHDHLGPYVDQPHFMGACVGRYANRIAGGRFQLDGRAYDITRNEGANSLHGGVRGLDKAVWRTLSADRTSVVFSHLSPDGDQGFPGAMTITAAYRLSPDTDELTLTLEARSDAPTVVSLAPHGYFNLAGAGGGRDVLDHELTVAADAFTPVDDGLIPTGEVRPVAGGPFDFRRPGRIGARIRDGREPQLRIGRGYDHNYVLNKGRTPEPEFAARLADPGSGRVMEILTTEPGMQFYSGNFLTGELTGKGEAFYRQGDGLCLEPQNFPDAPNQPHFPGARLDPGQTYRHVTVWRFSTL